MSVAAWLVWSATPLAPEPDMLWQIPGEGRGMPALHRTSIYFLSSRHEVVAVNATTGAIEWRRHTGEPGETTAGSTIVSTPSGVIAGDYNLVSFDHDGRLRWRFTPAHGYAPGVYLGHPRGDLVFAGSASGHVYAVDIVSGVERWRSRVTDDERTTVFAPVADDDLVFAGFTSFSASSSGGVAAFDVATGFERWRRALPSITIAAGAGLVGGPVIAGDVVAIVNRDGSIHAVDRVSGADRWSWPPVDSGETAQDYRALVMEGHTLVAGSLTGTVVAYDLETRRERWRKTPIGASTSFRLSTDAHTVYVPHFSGHLVALDLEDGTERWRTRIGSRGFTWPPLAEADRVYVAASAVGFFAFRR